MIKRPRFLFVRSKPPVQRQAALERDLEKAGVPWEDCDFFYLSESSVKALKKKIEAYKCIVALDWAAKNALQRCEAEFISTPSPDGLYHLKDRCIQFANSGEYRRTKRLPPLKAVGAASACREWKKG